MNNQYPSLTGLSPTTSASKKFTSMMLPSLTSCPACDLPSPGMAPPPYRQLSLGHYGITAPQISGASNRMFVALPTAGQLELCCLLSSIVEPGFRSSPHSVPKPLLRSSALLSTHISLANLIPLGQAAQSSPGPGGQKWKTF